MSRETFRWFLSPGCLLNCGILAAEVLSFVTIYVTLIFIGINDHHLAVMRSFLSHHYILNLVEQVIQVDTAPPTC